MSKGVGARHLFDIVRGGRFAPRGWHGRNPDPLDNNLVVGSQPGNGLDRRVSGSSRRSASARYRGCRAEADRPGPRRRPGARAGLRTRRVAGVAAGGCRRLRRGHPRAAGPQRVGPGAGVRRGLLLHPHLVDALGRHGCLAGPRRHRGPLLRPPRLGGRGAAPAPVVAAVAGHRVGLDGGLAQRLAVQRHALGPALLRRGRHPGRGRAALRRRDRRLVRARARRHPARRPGPGAWPGTPRGRRSAGRRRRAARRTGAGTVVAHPDRGGDGGRGPRRRARAGQRHPLRRSRRHPQPRRGDRRPRPAGGTGRGATARLRGLAGELHGLRPVPRR